jgi:hypothetical protein
MQISTSSSPSSNKEPTISPINYRQSVQGGHTPMATLNIKQPKT